VAGPPSWGTRWLGLFLTGLPEAHVAAHSSFPQGGGQHAQWLSRYAAYAIASGAEPTQANNARAAVDANLSRFSPEQDARILRNAGFKSAELFYAAFTWRGWIAYA
jgi:tRNA (cmo5U34)-methyltransferase